MTEIARQRTAGARSQGGVEGPTHGQDLFSAAIAMLESAREVSEAATSAGAAAAIPAALTPLETVLGELERTASTIEAVARQRLSTARRLGGRWDHENMMRTVREFEDLTRALQMARLASTTARDCAGPVLAELTRI
jgi:hypothetical protein